MADPNKWLGLMKWTMAHTDGTMPSDAQPISQEKRDFLEKVLNEGVIDENERVRDILRIMEGEDPRVVFARPGQDAVELDKSEQPSAEELAQYKDELLDELLTRIDQIDNAQNLVKNGGLRVLVHVMQTYSRASTRALAAEVFSVVVQNNPFCQDAAVEARVLEVLCAQMRDDEDTTCKVKALLGVSCLVRLHAVAEKQFLAPPCNGLALLHHNLETATDLRLQRKSMFFLRYLIRNSVETAKLVLAANFYVQSAAAFIASEDVDLCEGALEGLAEFAMLGPDFMAACKDPAVELQAKLQQRIALIDALEGEEKEFAQETRLRVELLQKVISA